MTRIAAPVRGRVPAFRMIRGEIDMPAYRRGGGYRYATSATAAGLAVLILFWLGMLAIAWPWAASPAVIGSRAAEPKCLPRP